MTDTSQELAEQAAHERRLYEDLEYAIQFKKDEIYGDLVNFQQFMDDYQMNDEVAREFLRALCNIEFASKALYFPESDQKLNKARANQAVLDALSNIKDTLDAKIAESVRKE